MTSTASLYLAYKTEEEYKLLPRFSRVWLIFLAVIFLCTYTVNAQSDSLISEKGTIITSALKDSLNDSEKLSSDSSTKKVRIDSLRNIVEGYPVIVNLTDTLFVVHSSIGESSPKKRAKNITNKIIQLQKDDFVKIDSILVVETDNTFDIVYGEAIIIKISSADAAWYDKSQSDLANELSVKIKESIIKSKEEHGLVKLLQRIGLALLVLVILRLVFWLIGKGNTFLFGYITKQEGKLSRKLSYGDYTFLTPERIMRSNLFALKILRWFLYALFAYFALSIIFNIFPFSRAWSHALFQLIWTPLKDTMIAAWEYLPNLFTVVVIIFVMKYFIRFIKYIFAEIETEKLKISGFYSDWARPTFALVRLMLYAFTLVLIFPYLPGSDSDIFKGVSIFIGVLLSLGSSSAVGNMIAGLMITYMRPFKIGDRIEIAGVSGDVVEKTLLVTRLKTSKNEVITIPNSSILSGNTKNYTLKANEEGLIIHTTVTIGYDVPWKDVYRALIDAALNTEMILKEPQPFVLQTSLDDFYVSYQINAYTKEASRQARLYSYLHQNIQNVFNERAIEILSPHYRADRDGNMTTIPADYLPRDYKPPSFKVSVEKDEKRQNSDDPKG